MQPIVDGLHDEYAVQVEFLDLNALDGAVGQTVFDQLGLPGHPSIVLYDVDGQQAYWGVGIMTEQLLRQEITQVLNDG